MEEIQETTPVETVKAEPEEGGGLSNRQIIGVVLIALAALLIIGAIIFGLVTHPTLTEILRDISIIILALVTVVIGLFLIILIFQLQSLIALLRDEVKPILESANETASTVRGTTTFLSDSVVTPMIQVASLTSGIVQTVRVLVRPSSRKRRKRSQPGAGPET